MEIKVGLTDTKLTDLLHNRVDITSRGAFSVSNFCKMGAGDLLSMSARDSRLQILLNNSKVASAQAAQNQWLRIDGNGSYLSVISIKRAHGKGTGSPSYRGPLLVKAIGNKVRLVLVTDLETYLKGVLDSEIPGSYHIEAIKSQAVAARTYGINPRINHGNDECNVCDSYLCCQYFAGHDATVGARHAKAIAETAGQILTVSAEPILALFSSNAGGHTENYENCFSDPETNQFPPQPRSYLKGVAEGDLPADPSTEEGLRKIWHSERLKTADSWSPHFKWTVNISSQSLESHMHHVVDQLLKKPDMAPFIVSPPAKQFGHIKRLSVANRGVSGTAISLKVDTSAGQWTISKELVIRSIFSNPDLKISRLKSARFFIDHSYDKLGLLSHITMKGMGWGHGVGMQQTGSQGFALAGKTYKHILSHYFSGARITMV